MIHSVRRAAPELSGDLFERQTRVLDGVVQPSDDSGFRRVQPLGDPARMIDVRLTRLVELPLMEPYSPGFCGLLVAAAGTAV